MTSLQEPAGGSKSLKFVDKNPLDPLMTPTAEEMNNEQQDIQREVAKNVNQRLEKAMDELKEKHRRGTNEEDDPDRAPTGEAYRRIEDQQRAIMRNRQQQQQLHQKEQMERELADREYVRKHVAEQIQKNGGVDNCDNDSNDDDDSDFDDLLDECDDDPVLAALRARRLQEMKQAQIQKAQDLARGHGQYRTIAQDEFLPECTGSSEYVVVHFYHDNFERCKIMDHHLKMVALQHTECKFVRINAVKAPFFVTKLQVRTLPTLLVFRHGKAVDRLTGFDGLVSSIITTTNINNNAHDGDALDAWETSRLQEWLARTGAINYKAPTADLRDEIERLGLRSRLPVYRGGVETYDDNV